MDSTATLTSLAMLKVNIDQGKDYLDYLVPFILQILVDHKPDPVTDSVIKDYIRTDFGLEIPERAIQIVLKRLSRKYPLKKEMGVYHIVGDLPDPEIFRKKAEAERHIRAVITGLKEFSRSTVRPIRDDEDAVKVICAFLAKFDIPCLRAYLRGTAIPSVASEETGIVLMSQYLLHLQERDPERFDSFMIIVQGHMLANALLAPDLQNAPKTYVGVTFYLDTPLVLRLLGLEGEYKRVAVEELTKLLKKLGGTIAVFSHTREETRRVIIAAAADVDRPDGRMSSIVKEARRNGRTKSDLLLIAEKIEDRLHELGIRVENTPRYRPELQIDEVAFENVLEDEVSYYNPRAKEYDINSVRSIYVLRQGTSPSTLEKARAVLVTSNSGFARAAYEYGKQFEESREVSSVITDFSLMNLAWLKAPMGAPSLPRAEILALAYAALQPPKELLAKYLREIEKLEREGEISPRDHQLLRSSVFALDELMHLTLGDERELTEETITETLQRVTEEIKKEEMEKFEAEKDAHRKTQQELALEREKNRKIQEKIYWRCRKKARIWARIVSLSIVVLLASGLIFANLKLGPGNSAFVIALKAVLNLVTLSSLIVGFTVKEFHQKIETCLRTWFIKREAAVIGLDLSEFDS